MILRIGEFSLFGLVGIALVVFLGWLWIRYCQERGKTGWIAGPYLFAVLACLVIWTCGAGIDEDESEQWHCAWMVAHGQIPYLDFWQHHYPTSYLVLAPIVRAFHHPTPLFIFSRILCIAITVLLGFMGWRLSRKVWGAGVTGPSYLLAYLSGCAVWQCAWMRADLLALLLIFSAFALTLRALDGSATMFLFSGICFGAATTFTPKQAAVAVVPLLLLLRFPVGRRLRPALLYLAGLALGATPLFLYLLHHGILGAFYESTVSFNGERTFMVAILPVALMLLAVAGWARLGASKAPTRYASTIRLGFLVALLSTLPEMIHAFSYYTSTVCVIAAILAAGLQPEQLLGQGKTAGWKTLALAFLLCFLIEPALAKALDAGHMVLPKDLARLERVLALAGRDPVVTPASDHPIFAADATRLYTRWQVRFAEDDLKRKRRTDWQKGFVHQVIAKSPAVISWAGDNREIVEGMRDRQTITPAAYDSVRSFLNQRYVPLNVDGRYFYVRKDRLRMEGFVPR